MRIHAQSIPLRRGHHPPRYLRVSSHGSGATTGEEPLPTEKARGKRHHSGISATFAGLAPSTRDLPKQDTDEHLVLAVHEVSSHSIDVNPATGAIAYSGNGVLDDPLGGEIFDTPPEFAQSAEGHAQANGRDETV